jgi:toxin FitB
LVTDTTNGVSVVSCVETLGFHRITSAQVLFFENLFKILRVVSIDENTIREAIVLRQSRKMTLGDALIGATALVLDAELVTRNVADFEGIPNLKIINPIG